MSSWITSFFFLQSPQGILTCFKGNNCVWVTLSWCKQTKPSVRSKYCLLPNCDAMRTQCYLWNRLAGNEYPRCNHEKTPDKLEIGYFLLEKRKRELYYWICQCPKRKSRAVEMFQSWRDLKEQDKCSTRLYTEFCARQRERKNLFKRHF